MEVVIPRCAGLDVHKRTVVACVRRLETDGRIDQEVRTFGTMTTDLLKLADWLAACGVTQVAMESTGVYWKPVFNADLRGPKPTYNLGAQHTFSSRDAPDPCR